MRVENKPSVSKPSSTPADKKPAKPFDEVLEGRRQAQPPADPKGKAPGKGAAPQPEQPLIPTPGKGPAKTDEREAAALSRRIAALSEKKDSEEEAKPASGGALPASVPFTREPAKTSAEQVGATASTRTIERVADEIAVLTRADGSQEVQIEVDSKVLQDLRISISQRDGEVSIRLMTDSQQTARLLNEGMPQLMAALQTRHVSVAGIQVAPRVTPSGAESQRRFRGKDKDRSGRDRDGGRGR